MNIVTFISCLAWVGLVYCIIGSFACIYAESKYRKSFRCALKRVQGTERTFFTTRYLAGAIVCGAWLISTL